MPDPKPNRNMDGSGPLGPMIPGRHYDFIREAVESSTTVKSHFRTV